MEADYATPYSSPTRIARPCAMTIRCGRGPSSAWPCAGLERLCAEWDGPIAYPVAVGVAAAGQYLALAPALQAFLHALTANMISAGLRLIPLGPSDGPRGRARPA